MVHTSSKNQVIGVDNTIKEYNAERDRIMAQEGSLLLYESYFLQYNSLLLNCKKQYLKLVNLDVYKIIEKFWTKLLPICDCDVSPSRCESYT